MFFMAEGVPRSIVSGAHVSLVSFELQKISQSCVNFLDLTTFAGYGPVILWKVGLSCVSL